MKLLANKTVLTIFLSSAFVFAAFTAYLPVLPIYLADLGASNFQIGAVMSAFPVGVLLFRPVVSWMISNKTRKWTLIFGTTTLALSTALYLIFRDITLLMFVRLIHGTGLAAFTTAAIVIISDMTTSENRSEALGLIIAANYVGFGLGPLFAGLLFQYTSITSVFILALVLSSGSVLLSGLVQAQKEVHVTSQKAALSGFINKRWFLVPLFYLLIVSFCHGGVIIFLPLHLRQFSNLNAGYFFLFFSIAVLFVRLGLGSVFDKFGRGITIFAPSFIVIAAIYFIGQAPSLIALVSAALLYGSGFGIQQPSMLAHIADNSTYTNRGAMFTVYYAIFDIGMLLSGYVFGAIADRFSVDAIFTVAVFVYASGIFVFFMRNQSSIWHSIKWTLSLKKHA